MGKITVENLSKSFDKKNIFHKFDMEVQEGEILGIRGKTGIGKTTLLRCIADLENYEGNIDKEGEISYLFQKPRLLPWMNVRKNILLPFKLQKKDVKEKHLERMKELSKNLDVDGHLDKRIGEISGGQKQRVLQIRALITKPDILLLDEPFSSLDSKTREEAYNKILETCKDENITTLVASHYEDIRPMMDRVIEFQEGESVSMVSKRS